MPYIKYISLLAIGFLIGNYIDFKIIPNNRLIPLSVITQTVYANAYRTDLLHNLKLGKINKSIVRVEENVAKDVIFIDGIINETEVTPEEKQLAIGSIKLLSVMNEKFNMPTWKNNKELISIFNKAQKTDPKKIEWYRCKDWSKPMWVGKDCNEKD